ncbi:MAG: PLP-dependent lyase/thiolase [Candidatus Eisenbacteria bacterium]|nr:PLP-dependent lyase/thiolase [Candidatus Eisenbacteria bacterium]
MSDAPATRLECAACGAAPDARAPWRCPNAGRDDLDHIVARRLDAARATFPCAGAVNPFVRFRTLLHSYHAARAGGMSDADFVALVEELDRAVAEVDSRGFVATPFARSGALGESLGFASGGGVWVKDETGNVSGSHKARHLFGIALVLEVMERTGLASRAEHDRRGLAIASCGNAALAAAVVARAARRPLEVFIPPDADPKVVKRLQSLDAHIAVCPRAPGEKGDPCYHAFRRALEAGALPFCCQGSDNGLTIEGGETLAWEIAAALADDGLTLDRLFVQVGGGALASACAQGLREAVSLGALAKLPQLHAVQTFGAFPRAARATPPTRRPPSACARPTPRTSCARSCATRRPTAPSSCGRGRSRRGASPTASWMTRPTTGTRW